MKYLKSFGVVNENIFNYIERYKKNKNNLNSRSYYKLFLSSVEEILNAQEKDIVSLDDYGYVITGSNNEHISGFRKSYDGWMVRVISMNNNYGYHTNHYELSKFQTDKLIGILETLLQIKPILTNYTSKSVKNLNK